MENLKHSSDFFTFVQNPFVMPLSTVKRSSHLSIIHQIPVRHPPATRPTSARHPPARYPPDGPTFVPPRRRCRAGRAGGVVETFPGKAPSSLPPSADAICTGEARDKERASIAKQPAAVKTERVRPKTQPCSRRERYRSDAKRRMSRPR